MLVWPACVCVCRLHRTEFFPGLGWLLPRELWEKELAASWPDEHWDHWLRYQLPPTTPPSRQPSIHGLTAGPRDGGREGGR